jgi:NADPH:quinone reductase-like Zn-dependent oxidoreductase
LGADSTIDYLKEDFTKSKEKYDFVFDAVGKSTFSKCKPVLKEKGIYISSELGPNGQNLFLPLTTSLLGGKKVVFPIPSNIKASIKFVKELIEKNKFKAVIDKSYSLEEIKEAYKYVANGEKTGNVIIKF